MPHRKIIDGFIEPPLAETLAATDGDESKRIDDSSAGALLSHLVAHTQGTFDCSKFPSIIRSC
jgi:hypothetical protein